TPGGDRARENHTTLRLSSSMAKRRNRQSDPQQIQLRIAQLESFLRVWQFVKGPHARRPFQFRDDAALQFAEAQIAMMLYSMLFSVFDPSGVDIRRFVAVDPELRQTLSDLCSRWQSIEKPITQVRNNFTFHGARAPAGTQRAMTALQDLGTDGSKTAMEL